MKYVYPLLAALLIAPLASADVRPEPTPNCPKHGAQTVTGEDAAKLAESLPGNFETGGILQTKVLLDSSGEPRIVCRREVLRAGKVLWQSCDLQASGL